MSSRRKVFFWTLAGLLFASAVQAGSTGLCRILVGSGDPELDLPALREAVAEGGTVRLEGTFDLGPDGSIAITRDVVLTGEADPGGRPVTRILGGRDVLTVDADVRLTVRSLRFEEATASVIRVRRATGLAVEKCAFLLVRPQPGWYPFVGSPFRSATAISVAGWRDDGRGSPFSVRGEILIRDNTVNLNPDPGRSAEYDADFSYGIEVDLVAADVRIEGNDVRHTNSAGIKVVEVLGPSLIRDNRVAPGPAQRTALSMGDGIVAGTLYGFANLAEGAVEIRRNEVTCVNGSADGIVLTGRLGDPDPAARYVVSKNRVTMTDTAFGALTGYWGLENSIWSYNRVEGTMGWAVAILPVDSAAAHSTILRNDLSRAVTRRADVVLERGTSRSVLVGSLDTLESEGGEDLVKGVERGHPEPGPDDERWRAMYRKHAWMRGLRPTPVPTFADDGRLAGYSAEP